MPPMEVNGANEGSLSAMVKEIRSKLDAGQEHGTVADQVNEAVFLARAQAALPEPYALPHTPRPPRHPGSALQGGNSATPPTDLYDALWSAVVRSS